MELTPTLILNLALLIVPPVALVLVFRQWLARHIRWTVALTALPDVMTPHTMRHTFCTRMANAGMNPKALQYIMGHANIVMTLNYYAHATFHSAQEEMERLQAKAKTTTEAKPEPAAESAEETKAA